MLRAPLTVAAIPAHRRRAAIGWLAMLVGVPLVCFLANRLIILILAYFPDQSYATQILLDVGVNATLAVSLNLINGYTGQFSLGHAGFMAIGAYTAAGVMFYVAPQWPSEWVSDPSLVTLGGTVRWALWFSGALVGAGLAAAVAGLVVGVPSLRLKGDYLAIVTLGFGEIIRVILLNFEPMRGARGFSDITKIDHPFFVLLVLLVCVVVTRNLVASTRGLAFLAVRDDEIAAEAVGVNTTRYKVSAFVVGAFFAGVAGGVYSHTQAYIIPSSFDFVKSMEIVAMVVLGGMGSIGGSILAAVGLTLLPEILRGGLMPEFMRNMVPDAVWAALPVWRMVIYSLILISAMLIQSRGKAFKNRKVKG